MFGKMENNKQFPIVGWSFDL